MNTYQTITADGTANQKNCPITRKASLVKEIRVVSQEAEYFTYNTSKIRYNQLDMLKARAAPTVPSLNLNIRAQHRGTWKHKTTKELASRG